MSLKMSSRQERATLAQKIQVLDYFHSSGSSQLKTVNKFRNELSISKSSLSEWLKREEDLRRSFAREEFRLSKNSRRKVKFKYERINKAMDALVQARLDKNEPISEPILREHWSVYAHQYGVDDPKRLISFSHGWLNQFKKRHGLRRSPSCHKGSLIRQFEKRNESDDVNMESVFELSADSDTSNGTPDVKTGAILKAQSSRGKVLTLKPSERVSSRLPFVSEIQETSTSIEYLLEKTDSSESITMASHGASEDTQLRQYSLVDQAKVTLIPPLFNLPLHDNIRRLFLKHPLSNPPMEQHNVQDSDAEAIQRLNKQYVLTSAPETQPIQQRQYDTSLAQSSKDKISTVSVASAASAVANVRTTITPTNPVETTSMLEQVETMQRKDSQVEKLAIENGHTDNQVEVERFIFTTADNFFQVNAKQYPETSKVFQSLKLAFFHELAIKKKQKPDTELTR